MGGFLTIGHNEIRDITDFLLTEVCSNVAIEPPLQPLTGETLKLASSTADYGSRLEVRARGFWNVRQDAFFDVRVFHPNAPSYKCRNLPAVHKSHEEKSFNSQRVHDIEQGVLPHLFFQLQEVYGKGSNYVLQASIADLLPITRKNILIA